MDEVWSPALGFLAAHLLVGIALLAVALFGTAALMAFDAVFAQSAGLGRYLEMTGVAAASGGYSGPSCSSTASVCSSSSCGGGASCGGSGCGGSGCGGGGRLGLRRRVAAAPSPGGGAARPRGAWGCSSGEGSGFSGAGALTRAAAGKARASRRTACRGTPPEAMV
ncbi:hypothetical protein F8568_012770 [Actinomadura sp. LD22]|uniref:Uncharacterized protein n=1 Tax=Actinomadura physcomitrii TaxID=2650748 RepID=A0A6I4MF42_9ACTN|nr:hypothetical protein [Actinomadura physcomitrii]MWA01239.1 hypothetical protein [Actinomadura physcomitrii]